MRDGLQMAVDGITEYLDSKTPYEKTVKHDPKDFDKLFWETKQGKKGPFERTSKKANNGNDIFQALQTILKKHGGFLQLGSYKYWFDNQDDKQNIIDRRKKGVETTKKVSEEPQGPIPLTQKASSSKIDDVKALFSKDLEDMLTFEETGEFIVIKPRQYLGSDDFTKIAAVIRGISGEYVSAGKQSHFRVPVK